MTASKKTGIDEILFRWRNVIKNKKRRIISFEETIEIKINAVKKLIEAATVPISGWEAREFHFDRHFKHEYLTDWRPIDVGGVWGGPDRSVEFRNRVTLPKVFAGKRVAMKLYFGGDGLLYVDKRPYHGLDPFRDTVPITDCAKGGETFDLFVEAYIFWNFGESERKIIESSHWAVIDQEMSDTYWDLRAVYNVFTVPDQDPELLAFLRSGLEKAIWIIDQNEADPHQARDNALRAREILRREIFDSADFRKEGLLHLAANSHLDVVYLWTHAEFVRKIGRTHATTLRLMEQYPDYLFSQSQALMYDEMKRHYPTLFEEVKQRIKEGRWEPIGAFWVEPDCNLISGESFVRQVLFGSRFYKTEFGVTPRTCWLPDVFGNAWTMPQILAKSGLKYFVTHKMAIWNDTNPWAKNIFWWQGPDGSRVLSLVPPTHFIGTNEPDHLGEHWAKFSNKSDIKESLYNFGWGDGGGGPDPEMLEYMKRYRNFPGVVPTKPNTIEGALDSIAGRAVTCELPVINDELYLEEHRGVLTTKGRLKKLNRRAEFLYRNAELWAVVARQNGKAYPANELASGWKKILTNQFHDSLPGTHIPPVYLDLLEAYDAIFATGEKVLHDAQDAIASSLDTQGEGRAVVIFNSRETARDTLVRIPLETGESGFVQVLSPKGETLPCQASTDFETGQPVLLFEACDLSPTGCSVYRILPTKTKPEWREVAVSDRILENDFLKITLNEAGEVISLVDKTSGREHFPEGFSGNVLTLNEDVPGNYEAWDIAPTYTKVAFDTGVAQLRVLERGAVRSGIEVIRKFGDSVFTQRIFLTAHGRRVDFDTTVDWKERQRILKARFFTPLLSRTATFDIAYGNIERSTSRNNSYEEAKFEVSAHLWADLSQSDYGLSLLNDCKYGHESKDGMLALTLLRGTTHPDPKADLEIHHFVYSLFPHEGGWREAGTMIQAIDLNDPVAVVFPAAGRGASSGISFLSLDSSHVTIEAVKKAEDSDHIVIRLVERHGSSRPAILSLTQEPAMVETVDLMEENPTPHVHAGNKVRLEFSPYEIKTLRIRMA